MDVALNVYNNITYITNMSIHHECSINIETSVSGDDGKLITDVKI